MKLINNSSCCLFQFLLLKRPISRCFSPCFARILYGNPSQWKLESAICVHTEVFHSPPLPPLPNIPAPETTCAHTASLDNSAKLAATGSSRAGGASLLRLTSSIIAVSRDQTEITAWGTVQIMPSQPDKAERKVPTLASFFIILDQIDQNRF